MASTATWDVDDAFQLVTRSASFRDLSREQFENVLDMLDGRYPSDRFADLRPRIVWDRTESTIEGRKGSRSLVVTNAGTIPDRGLYGVHLPDGRRVGELDEEMVHEARNGQVFLLGATAWRIQEITRDRVIVVPAPGAPGAIPFWRGVGIGRPAELGEALGRFSREAVEAIETRCWASTSSGLEGTTVSSISPPFIRSATTAASSRSPRNLGKIRPLEV
ncbi:MAG: hypothetical protein ACKORM_01825 [Solirubrobacterales bacterium]